MKRAFLALAFLLLLAISARAQTPSCLDSGESVVDTLHLQVSFSTSSSSASIAVEAFVGRTLSGRTDYIINTSSIKFSGDGSGINSKSTLQIFDMIAMATVSQGISQGLTNCPTSCTNPTVTKVITSGCVHRSGSDTNTHFEPCSPTSCCVRTYSVCCPNGTGSPVITLLSSQSSGCTPNSYCESTCP